MTDDKDWTIAPLPEVTRELHRLDVQIADIQEMYRALQAGEIEPLEYERARLREILQARVPRHPPRIIEEGDKFHRWWP